MRFFEWFADKWRGTVPAEERRTRAEEMAAFTRALVGSYETNSPPAGSVAPEPSNGASPGVYDWAKVTAWPAIPDEPEDAADELDMSGHCACHDAAVCPDEAYAAAMEGVLPEDSPDEIPEPTPKINLFD